MIGGEGGRLHSVEMAASLRHLAEELSFDLSFYPENDARAKAQACIARLNAAADEEERRIADYDRRMAPKITPGEADSFVKPWRP